MTSPMAAGTTTKPIRSQDRLDGPPVGGGSVVGMVRVTGARVPTATTTAGTDDVLTDDAPSAAGAAAAPWPIGQPPALVSSFEFMAGLSDFR